MLGNNNYLGSIYKLLQELGTKKIIETYKKYEGVKKGELQ